MKRGAEVLTNGLFQAQFLAGSLPVASEDPWNIVVPIGDPPLGRVSYSRRPALADIEPGQYTLRVLVTDWIAHAGVERSIRLRIE